MKLSLMIGMISLASISFFQENAEARQGTKTGLQSCQTLSSRMQSICSARNPEAANSKTGDTALFDACLRSEARRLIAGASAQKRCRFDSSNYSIVNK